MNPAEIPFKPGELDALYAEARALRDIIYGPCTEGNWEACKDLWLSPDNLRWLRANAKPD